MGMERGNGRRGVREGQKRSTDLVASIRRQSRDLRWIVLGALLAFAVVFGLLVAIRATEGIPIAEFTRDPLGFTDLPVYKGAVSNLGVLIWMSGAAISIFSYGLLRLQRMGEGHSTFLLAAGFVTLILVLDDLYMLHEVVFPDYVGIPQDIVYGAYGVAIVWLLVWYRRKILETDFLLLGLGLAGFGTSILADAVAAFVTIPAYYIIEDGGKFFGIVTWTAYLVMTSAQSVRAYLFFRGPADESGAPGMQRAGLEDSRTLGRSM